MNRIMIFIDAEYVVEKMKALTKGKKSRKDINWGNIIRWTVGKSRLVRAYYYSAEFSQSENPRTYKEQHEYLLDLKKSIPYFEIKLGRLMHDKQGWSQKGVDVKIALDMFDKAVTNQYDTAALFSGDSDFTEVITEIKGRYGKHVELYTLDKSIHETLMVSPDKHIIIDSQVARKNKFWSD